MMWGDIMDIEKLTPMMKQYMEVKDRYKDAILFYRLGDFYEMFMEDALVASKVLDIALTGRNAGLEERIPMCGVPFHACQPYINKLIDNGYKVAICEQLESPSDNKKIVKRDVVKVITPGTNLEVESNDYNYIMAIEEIYNQYVIALADLSTGKLKAIKILKDKEALYKQIKSYQVKEIVLTRKFSSKVFNALIKQEPILISYIEDSKDYHKDILNNIEDDYIQVFKNLLSYIEAMQMHPVDYYLEVEYPNLQSMTLDFSTKYALELTSTMKSRDKYGTLFWYLDKTKTAMGSRLLKEYIESPLLDEAKINQRLDFVQVLINQFITSETIIQEMKNIYDMYRLTSKLALGTILPRECFQLLQSLQSANKIKEILSNINDPLINDYLKDFDSLLSLQESIKETIDPSILDGNNDQIILPNIDKVLDEYRSLVNDSTKWLLDFEQRQKDLTGIKNLKVKYNKVFGYYIEVSNANKDLIKDEYGYIRKQTLTNAERYINNELKNQEALILNAFDNLNKLENELYKNFVKEITSYTKEIQSLANKLSYLDVMLSFYTISNQYGYTRPSFNHKNIIDIKDSFHPVLKAIDQDHDFINNDFIMDESTNILIITGPNMGGKSTYERQLAIIIIMAQMGCFVPALSCNIKLFDQIFTRIGANDNQLEGQSTFMVEMLEASYALNNATDNSLILFDELGRGTATYDGLSIANAMLQYLAKNSKAKVIFSTHYHELTQLANDYPTIKNYHASVIETKNEITFTYKIKPGYIEKSYGIHVAKLANMPRVILQNATQLLFMLEQDKRNISGFDYQEVQEPIQEEHKVVSLIKEINVNELTPLQAISLLDDLVKQVNEDE